MRKYVASLAVAVFVFGLVLARPASAAQHPLPATPATIAVYASVLHKFNPHLPNWESRDLARRVLVNAARWRLDANILVAIVSVESNWHTDAVSRAGAIGLGQLMPGTAATLGVDPNDPGQNLSGAAEYLSNLMARFASKPNRYELVFAAYNAGPKAVADYGGIPPFDETQRYVVKVLHAWEQLRDTVHVPNLLAAIAHGPDVDYWLDAQTR